MGFEPVHSFLPGSLAREHPVDGLVERLRIESAAAPLRVPAANDQSGVLKHLEMPRDRRPVIPG